MHGCSHEEHITVKYLLACRTARVLDLTTSNYSKDLTWVEESFIGLEILLILPDFIDCTSRKYMCS